MTGLESIVAIRKECLSAKVNGRENDDEEIKCLYFHKKYDLLDGHDNVSDTYTIMP